MIQDLPFQSRYWWRGAYRYHYFDEGAGEPIVLVHGNPTWSYHYRRLVAALRDRYRLIAPDHMGCGRSDRPGLNDYDYRLASRVADLEALLDGLGLREKLTFVLHDWGGMIGLGYATRYPDRIARLVLLNTAGFHLPKNKRFPLLLRLARSAGLGEWLVRGANLFAWSVGYFGCRRRQMPERVRKQYLAPYSSWRDRLAIYRFVRDIPLRESDPSYSLVSTIEQGLARLRDVPAQIFWGERDFVFDRHFLARWREVLPQARIRLFPDCGHFVLEDAFEEILPEFENFLAGAPAATMKRM